MTEKIEFPAASDDWGTITEVFFPGRGDITIDLGDVKIEYYDIREVRAVELAQRCMDDD